VFCKCSPPVCLCSRILQPCSLGPRVLQVFSSRVSLFPYFTAVFIRSTCFASVLLPCVFVPVFCNRVHYVHMFCKCSLPVCICSRILQPCSLGPRVLQVFLSGVSLFPYFTAVFIRSTCFASVLIPCVFVPVFGNRIH